MIDYLLVCLHDFANKLAEKTYFLYMNYELYTLQQLYSGKEESQ